MSTTFVQFLLASIVSGVMLFGAVYIVLQKLLTAENRRRNIELLQTAKEITLPLRLQAHERLLLFLERISPNALVLRLHRQNTSNADLHRDLVAAVRSEFEHNLAQQLYVSHDLWGAIVLAKNNVIGCITTCTREVEPHESSIQLAQKMLEWHVNNDVPTESAIAQLKKEVAKLF